MTEKEIADLDAVVVYYMCQGWPWYSEQERIDHLWSDDKASAQQAAFDRHMARKRS